MADKVISSQDLKKAVSRMVEIPDEMRVKMMAAINQAEDAVVRCKECQFWSDGIGGCTDHVKVCKIGFYMVSENGYCVFGERKENGK